MIFQSVFISLISRILGLIGKLNSKRLSLFIGVLLSCNLYGLLPVDVNLKSHVDLRNSSEKWANPIELSGKWDFYWNEFIDPVTLQTHQKPLTVQVPSYWNTLKKDGKLLPQNGFCSYALKIILPPDFSEQLAIFFPSVDVAYRLFVDGEEVYNSGRPAQTAEEEYPYYRATLIPFHPKSDTVSVVLHVSNFHHRRGGIWQTPTFGTAEVMVVSRKTRNILDNLTLGILISFGLFFFIFSFYYKSERAILFFAIAFVFMFLRGMSTNQIPLAIITDISWNWVVRLEYLSMFLTLFFGMWGFNFLVPIAWIQRFLKFINYFIVLICAFILFFPVNIFAYSVFLFEAMLLLGFCFFGVQTYTSLKNGFKYSYLYLIAIFFLFVGGVHDTLVSNSLPAVFNFYIMPHLYIFFIFAQSVEFFRRFSQTMDNSERLSRELTLLNQDLEEKIQKRTLQLQEKTAIIETQNKKLQKDIYLKNRFFSVIGHDISSPLASIRQGLELVTNPDIQIDEKDHFLNKINQSAQSLSILVENLLSWGLSQNNQLKLNPENDLIYPCIHRVVQQINSIADDKGIQLINHVSTDTSAFFDEITLVIIVRNLLTNALKFTPIGGRIEISEVCYDNFVTITVTDTGIGMQRKKIEQLISGEEVVSTAGTNNERGTGLGLSLCKDLIHLNGGELMIKSELGKGSSFSFTIPLTDKRG